MAKGGTAKKGNNQINGGDSKLLYCGCVHAGQDQLHNTDSQGRSTGTHLRVHNATSKGFRCTVCGTNK